MKHTIQEAQQALKLLMDNKERIIELCSQMENVCSEYNDNAATESELEKNYNITMECMKLRGELEPFNNAQSVIIGFLRRMGIDRHDSTDFKNRASYSQFLIDFQKLFIDLDGKFFDPSNYVVYMYKLNEAFGITPNHFIKIDGRGAPDIYSFEPDEAKIEARRQEAQKQYDDELRRREEELAKAISIQQQEAPQPKHFTRSFTSDEQKKLYDGLIEHGYLPAETPKEHFDFVFGTKDDYPQDFKPLQWQKTGALFALFIDTLFGDLGVSHWEIAKDCFQNKGKELNIDTLKNDVSKNKHDWKKIRGADELLKILTL
ncbi:MAG: hypothetical protein MdMp024_1823 [Bacteroidales bacterium]